MKKNFLRKKKKWKKNGNWTRGEVRMKRNLHIQIKFFYGLNAFSPFHKTFPLHDLGPGHPGTLEIKRSADPPGNHVLPDHRPPPLHGDDRPPTLLHGEVQYGQFSLQIL